MDEYLYKQSIHKTFHGVLSLIFGYLKDNYGEEDTLDIVKTITKKIYSPLISDLRDKGLEEMEKHVNMLMELEKGDHTVKWEDGNLVVNVHRCPAIDFMKKNGHEISDNFCRLSTVAVNTVIAEESGYEFSVDYSQDEGRCTQVFREVKK